MTNEELAVLIIVVAIALVFVMDWHAGHIVDELNRLRKDIAAKD